MHDFVTHLSVRALFGYVHHEIDFRVEEQITILTGVNGSGKTHVLNLLRAILNQDVRGIALVPFASARLDFDSDRSLEVERLDVGTVAFSGSQGEKSLGYATAIVVPDQLEQILPDYFEKVEDDIWRDLSDGELIHAEVLRRRYGAPSGPKGYPAWEFIDVESPEDVDWLRRFRPSAPPTFVETQRLDLRSARVPVRSRTRSQPISRIRQYVDEVSEQIAAARRRSLEVSQRADRQFAARALDKARATVKESELRKNYQALAQLNQELHQNGLTEPSMGLEFPGGRTNPTERRILSVFLEDWASKLEALEEVHEKVQTLRVVVGLKVTGKTIQINDGQLLFTNDVTGEQVHVDRLSSGEQHLVALFTMLIFSAQPGSLVLIDEPEISLHAAWKHAFLDDLREVAELNDLQVVLATHSSGIVHGEWDLAEELTVPGSGSGTVG